MGYDVHITRKKRWSNEEGPEISFVDWTQYIKSDPEMRLEGFAEATNPQTGESVRYENPGLAVWQEPSPKPRTVWFDFRRGKIVVKNPDRETLGKMWRIAQALSGQVQGDDGEIYSQNGDVVR